MLDGRKRKVQSDIAARDFPQGAKDAQILYVDCNTIEIHITNKLRVKMVICTSSKLLCFCDDF